MKAWYLHLYPTLRLELWEYVVISIDYLMTCGRQIGGLIRDSVLSKPMLCFVFAEPSALCDRWFSMLVSLICFEILVDMCDPFGRSTSFHVRRVSCKLQNFSRGFCLPYGPNEECHYVNWFLCCQNVSFFLQWPGDAVGGAVVIGQVCYIVSLLFL
jgi:hypothetical protein